jgi:hypothetical protein
MRPLEQPASRIAIAAQANGSFMPVIFADAARSRKINQRPSPKCYTAARARSFLICDGIAA